jgi:hypothetical protein
LILDTISRADKAPSKKKKESKEQTKEEERNPSQARKSKAQSGVSLRET